LRLGSAGEREGDKRHKERERARALTHMMQE
jgi:hypothetical protein